MIVAGVCAAIVLAAGGYLVFSHTTADSAISIGSIPDQEVGALGTLRLTIPHRGKVAAGQTLQFALAKPVPGLKLDPASGELSWTPTAAQGPRSYPIAVVARIDQQEVARREFTIRVLEANVVAKTTSTIRPKKANEKPLVGASDFAGLAKTETTSDSQSMPTTPRTSPDISTPAADSMLNGKIKPPEIAADEKELIALYRANKLFDRREYPKLRKLMADRFEREHAEEIKAALGADYEAMQAWFGEHAEVREDLFTAIDPKHDRLPAVVSLFNRLRMEFPDQLEEYVQLAIATAVVWDDEGVIDDLEFNAKRTKSTVPSDRLDAMGNFKFLVDAEPIMQGRVQYAPWEFLAHMVNNKTPRPEREWAMQNYLQRRQQIGTCYSNVPYDFLMLKTDDKEARLNGQMYTLPNLLQFGGVCSQQADFAARVSKSIGAPAEVVGGTSSGGEGHAWVMWVELSHMTKDHVGFALQSHGRYRNHHYYVGTLRDPHTGQEITDRQLELRLHAAGSDIQAKRHADLAMRAYGIIFAGEKPTLDERIEYLAAVMNLCPANEDAWRGIAKLAKENAGDKMIEKSVVTAIGRMFTTFVAFPDFTWEIFDDLVSYDKNIRMRMSLISRLLKMYEHAGRPDLASKACLKLTDYLIEDKRKIEAIETLVQSISSFPKESTIVLPMLDRLESLCDETDGGGPHMVAFYNAFLPLVPPTIDGRVSPYCMKILDRAAARYKKAGELELAQAAETRLAQMKAMEGK